MKQLYFEKSMSQKKDKNFNFNCFPKGYGLVIASSRWFESFTLKAPIILRRDQINADFRNKAEDEGGDEAEDDEDQGDGEDEPTKPKRKTPTGKAKSKPKGKAKAKAKAKGRGRATASSKSKAAQKDEKDEEHKEDKAKADDKGKDDTKDKPVSSRKRKSVEPDTDQNVEGGDKDEPNAPKRRSGCGTFAGRYRPSDEGSLNRFMAIEKTFMEKIAPLIKRQSAFQDKWGLFPVHKLDQS